ncbi:PrgI family protein [Catenulispora subtropica]|uniref:PrgI family protein n=1 Tax=Catenulispora subtropica TaxID=450798 RepID=A0ABN2RBL8_9ACTN
MSESEFYYAARIPADIDRPDALVMGLSFRQVGIVAGTAAGCWLVYTAVHNVAPHLPVLAVLAPLAIVLTVAAGIAVGARDGISADRFLLAAARHARRPRRLVDTPEDEGVPPMPSFLPQRWRNAQGSDPSPLMLPVTGVNEQAVVDLRDAGAAGVAACSTVNFALRSAGEQNHLVAGFGRFLNSLSGPTQILIRTRRVDLAPMVAALEADAAGLAHPALEAAARDHAAFLAEISDGRRLLSRQVLLTVRELAAGKHGADAGPRITRRLAEAASALSGAGVVVAAYTPTGAADLLSEACAATAA